MCALPAAALSSECLFSFDFGGRFEEDFSCLCFEASNPSSLVLAAYINVFVK